MSTIEDPVVDRNLDSRNKSQRLAYLSPEELARRLRAEPAPLVLDVRDPHELEGELGQLPGVVNVPLGQLQQRLGELSAKGREDMVVVCRTGRRSETAARILRESGLSESLF